MSIKVLPKYFLPKFVVIQQETVVSFPENIAKGTTGPRVEFISQDHSSQILNILQFQNMD